MDYDIINQVYDEIIAIVNNYVRRTECSYEVARKLSFALLGYYLVIGPEIFEKINIVLDAINIYECINESEYCAYSDRKRFNDGYDEPEPCNPITMWDYKIDDNNKFLGGIPKVVYMRANDFNNVLSIAHEISHVLEGTSATVVDEDRKYVHIKQGFSNILVRKEDKRFRIEGRGFSELAAISLENRIVKEMLGLEVDKITSPLLKEFLISIKNYKSNSTMSRAYIELSTSFKDFMDNNKFYDLLKKYFYESDEAGFKAEFESLSPSLDYQSLRNSADIMSSQTYNFKQIMIYRDMALKQASIFNLATGFNPEKKLLILV